MTTHKESDPREVPRVNRFLVLYVAAPMLMATSVWLWVQQQHAKVRERGVASCVAAHNDASWCELAASKNHDRCLELTFRPASRTSPESFDDRGYVECLEMGADGYWRVSSERAAARRRTPPRP